MRNFIEARSYVAFDHPSVPCFRSTKLIERLDAVHRTASGSKAIGEVVEVCFPDGFHEHLEQGLNRSILYGWHPQSTLPHHPSEFRDG